MVVVRGVDTIVVCKEGLAGSVEKNTDSNRETASIVMSFLTVNFEESAGVLDGLL
jgi:hypothetical protein